MLGSVNVEFINAIVRDELRATFKVEGTYRGVYLNEVVTLYYKDIVILKKYKSETKEFQFLVYIKELKDNLTRKDIKHKMAELAYKQYTIKCKDIEYFKLLFELTSNNKKATETKYSGLKGRYIDIRM